ncbi:PucR family transcriptional regulator, partial [Streptomyces sp. NPDC057580]|uniref:PucR family transcriptional regulator n=1 Tax=Streptomyces sp. NPDC057580 TaxID=3346173 RepID=UPI0036A89D45
RVVAFSADQSRTDEGRRSTILGLRVPADVSDLQRREGVFRRIYASSLPVSVPDVVGGAQPRVAMRITAGGEALGSIWAITGEPLNPSQERGMVEAAQAAALTLLRARLGADAAARLRVEHLTALLDGGPGARQTAQKLGLTGRSLCVMALAAVPPAAEAPGRAGEEGAEHAEDPQDAVLAEAEQQRVVNALALYLRAASPRALSARVGSVLYAVVPLGSADEKAGREAVRTALDFLTRHDPSHTLRAGLGIAVADPSQLPDSRAAADSALRVLRRHRDPARHAVALEDVQGEHIMLRLADVLAADHITAGAPLRALIAYDAEHEGAMLPTLRAWLDSFGDTAAAARTAGVHKNTFRYRLRRIQHITGVDLDDPEVRFLLALELRVFT